MADEKFELTRRKALAGLGTIGAASAGAGLGTSAYFNDTESFDGNSLTAGTLNLKLEGNVVYTNRTDDLAPEVDDKIVEADGESKTLINFQDVKPGDCYIIQTDEIIEGNPAYLEMSFAEEDDSENGYTEPEPNTAEGGDSDESGSPDGGGELDDLMEVTAFYGGYDGNNSLQSISDESDLGVSGSTDQLIKTQTLQNAFDHLAEAANDSEEDETNPDEYEALAPHQTNINDEFVPGNPSSSGPPYAPNQLDPGRYRKFWLICLPSDVGNEVQGDSVSFSINARVEQVRHNDTPFDGDDTN